MTENSFTDRFSYFDENYKHIKENIAIAAEKSGRKPEEITLLAATKTVSVEVINHAIDAGINCIGENRVQELMDKYDRLHKENCDIQFIGRLQTNKVKYLIPKVSCIQSVDSVKLAKEISRISQREDVTTNVLIEVNVGSEESKGGISKNELYEFIDEIRELPKIHINGLMSIPPILDDKKLLASYFSILREYYVDITTKKLDNVSMECLSMGMSDDYALAIENGSNMIRVGSALFGQRDYR